MADGTKFSSIVWEVNEIGSIKNESEKKKKRLGVVLKFQPHSVRVRKRCTD